MKLIPSIGMAPKIKYIKITKIIYSIELQTGAVTLTQTEAAPRFSEWQCESSTGPLHSSPATGGIRWLSGWVPNSRRSKTVQYLDVDLSSTTCFNFFQGAKCGHWNEMDWTTGNQQNTTQSTAWVTVDFRFCSMRSLSAQEVTKMGSFRRFSLFPEVHLTSFTLNHVPKHACFLRDDTWFNLSN